MGILGKILAIPIRLLNVPARTFELLVQDTDKDDEDNLLSKPLETLAKAIEEVDELK